MVDNILLTGFLTLYVMYTVDANKIPPHNVSIAAGSIFHLSNKARFTVS